MSGEIPIIDFSRFLNGTEEEKLKVGMEIGEAAERIGFLVLKGHGVNEGVIKKAWQSTCNEIDRCPRIAYLP